MDPSAWPYAYNRLQTAAGQQTHELQHVAYTAAAAGTPHLLLHHQLRQAQAAHEITSQYQNMSLPPSLVQAAASNKSHLQHQALANLNMRESTMTVRGGGNVEVSITPRIDNFSSNATILTPPQTPGSTTWKSSNGSSGLVVIPEPQKSESRHGSVSNRHSSYSVQETVSNGSSRSGMRQGSMEITAVELKTSQPIFPGQPPPLSRVELKSSYNTPQPPPRQSSQPPQRSSTNNRTAFPGLQPPGHDFREPYQHHSELIIQRQQASPQLPQQQQQQQPSPQYYNNPSPQNVASPQNYHFQQNPSPHPSDQYYTQVKARSSSTSSSSRSKSSRTPTSSNSSRPATTITPKAVQIQQHIPQQVQHQQLIMLQQQQQQHQSVREQQDLGLARLGALGALADLSEGSDLMNDVPSTINYEDLGLGGNFVSQSRHQDSQRSSTKSEQKTSNWISRANELLDLSSGDSRDTPGQENELFAGLTQSSQPSTSTAQSTSQGLIPQIVMNPWDPSQAPVMTFAPLANAVQAYQQQWLTMQAQQQAAGIQQTESEQTAATVSVTVEPEAEEEEEIPKPKVICVSPDDEMGFLVDLPPPCNVILQPSTIGLSGKVPESPFLVAFQKFLKGEECTRPRENLTEAPSELPGRKKYIPPYTPKSALDNVRANPAPKHLTVPNRTPGPASMTGKSVSRTPSTTSRSSGGASQRSQATSKKRSRTNRNSDDDLELSVAELPKRESSRRKAKENSSTRRIMQERLLAEDDEEMPGLDLSDSDDDATWTPFKEKSNSADALQTGGSKHRRFVVSDEDDDEDDFDEDDLLMKKSKKPNFASANFSALNQSTSLVPDGQDFKTGDFVVLREDVEREGAPIWRFDSKTLLQRYNPEQAKNGEYLHKAANLFSGFVPSNRDRYVSVAVKFISSENGAYVIKVIQRGGKRIDPELRARSFTETSQFQENFEVYIQALISQCLDSNFLDEVFADQDEYFVSNIEKVDSVTLLRKDKLMNGVSWSMRFQQALCTWPCISDLGPSAAQDTRCGACERDRASTMVQMFGQPYHPNTLKIVPPNDEASLNRNFSVCKKCSRLAQLFHRLTHQKHRMFNLCSEVVEGRKRTSPAFDTTKILNELLANDQWLEQQFRKMQELWADADTFVR